MEKIIDTHAHYDDEAFDSDRDEALGRLFEESCKAVINIGCDLKNIEKTLELTRKFPCAFAAVGIHPEFASEVPQNFIEQLEKIASEKKVVALGEMGLDYHYEGYSREKQIEIFEKQLVLAKKLDMPAVIHSRDATSDTLDILRKHRPRGVVHCFSGSPEVAEEIIKLGMYISFTGVITFRNAKKAVASCAVIPLERLMLETDCPYMTPEPHRGQRCDSGFIPYTAAKIAEIKQMNTDELIKTCNKNAVNLFGLAKFKEMC